MNGIATLTLEDGTVRNCERCLRCEGLLETGYVRRNGTMQWYYSPPNHNVSTCKCVRPLREDSETLEKLGKRLEAIEKKLDALAGIVGEG